MAFSDPITGELVNGLKKVRYSHDAMIDLIIANPWIRQKEIAAHFGMTETWISICVNSDSFKARLAERKDEVVDPVIKSSIDDRMRSAVDLSLEVIQEKLRATGNLNAAIRVLEHGSRALGYGAQNRAVPVQVHTYVAVVPPKARDATQWLEQHGPRTLESIEAVPQSAPGPQTHTMTEVLIDAPTTD